MSLISLLDEFFYAILTLVFVTATLTVIVALTTFGGTP